MAVGVQDADAQCERVRNLRIPHANEKAHCVWNSQRECLDLDSLFHHRDLAISFEVRFTHLSRVLNISVEP